MNTETARTILSLHRADREPDSHVRKALRFAENHDTLRREHAEQADFDRQIVDVIQNLNPPGDLPQMLSASASRKSTARQALNPAILSAIFGLLLLLGVGVYFMLEASKDFPGRDWVDDFIELNNRMTGAELETTSVPAGELADNLMLRGFDGYSLPPELAKLPAVGWRVFRHGPSGHKVAQLAIDQNEMLVFVFRQSDFGVRPGVEGGWRVFRHAEWAAAIKEHGKLCILLTLHGTEKDMEANLRSLTP